MENLSFYVPGYKPSNIEYSMNLKVENLILCLEDGTPENKKNEARDLVRNFLEQQGNLGKSITVRINGYKTKHCKLDLEAILPYNPDRIRIPMLEEISEFIEINDFIQNFCSINKLRVPKYEIMIENKKMLDSIELLVPYIHLITAITLGGEDLEEDLKKYTKETKNLLLISKLKIIKFSDENNIKALDTTYMDYNNAKGFIVDSKKSKDIGFHGRSLMHPSQINPAKKIFI